MLFVCEGVRKAVASERQPQRAERAMYTEGAEGSSSASDDEVGGLQARLREQLQIRLPAMVTAIVFVNAEVARIPEVAEQIAALSGVSEVYSVTGTIDLIAMIRVANHDQIAEVVADKLNKVPGVVSTETHIAFRAYSAHDLEAAFSLGG
jgi:DNA-binding Lrp family transcriptional regulator